jgi:hypothetical protein
LHPSSNLWFNQSPARTKGPNVDTDMQHMQQWTSSQIQLSDGLVVEVRASAEGVTAGKQVDGVFASDTLYTPEQADQLGRYLIEGAARSLAMRK